MSDRLVELRGVLEAVRRRWMRRARLHAWALGAGSAAMVLLVGLLAVWLIAGEGLALVVVAAAVLPLALYCLVASQAPLNRPPSDAQLARFMEEQAGGLDDVLVTAVEKSAAGGPVQDSQMTALLVADAARAARELPPERVITPHAISRALTAAVVGSVALLAAVVVTAPAGGRAARVVGAYLFPARYAIDVQPGSIKARAGQPLTIRARIPGLDGALVPVLTVGAGSSARTARMNAGETAGDFTLTLDDLRESFPYSVAVGAAHSPEYTVTVIRPPRVSRIDLRFEYPKAFGLTTRDESGGGDILAPAGTTVQVTITTDKPVTRGELAMTGGAPLPLEGSGQVLTANLTVRAEGSYRIALHDMDGLDAPGDTEYFIRMIDDRLPDVRILRPAGDKQVSPLEEVAIEASADDDYGVASLELVVQASNGKQSVVPLSAGGPALSVAGRHTLFLEDLKVKPGEFVTYFARARDVARGRRSAEARSDIFFLEVKPYEQEFVSAESQAMGGGQGQDSGVEALAALQKDIIAATWKLDERARKAKNARSATDIKAVAEAQRSLKERAEDAAGEIARTTADPRRRRGLGADAMPSRDDPMTRAVEAMAEATDALNRLQTGAALPPEMEALNQLLKAAAEIRRRQVQRQQAQGGGNGNREAPDMSTLFDQELRKKQQTNYETPSSSESRDDEVKGPDPLDKIRELARRQEALAKEQRDLAKERERLADEELKRRLARLTRDQEALRQEAEQLSQQLQQQAASSQPQEAASKPSSGSSPASSGGRGGSASGQSADSQRMREVSEEMRKAASDLNRQDPQQASARGDRATQQLRSLEQRIQGTRPDERRRALGDMQLEARQLADAQRRLGRDASRSGAGAAGEDARRRMAAEQERLADRADRLGNSVRQLNRGGGEASDAERSATDEAAKELQASNVSERMRQVAEQMRTGTNTGGAPVGGERPANAERTPGAGGAPGEEAARALDRAASRLGVATGSRDAESERLSEQMARTQELRDRLEGVQRSMDALAHANQPDGKSAGQGSPQGSRESGSPGPAAGSEAAPSSSRGAQPGAEGQEGGAGEQGGAAGGRAGQVAQLRRDVDDKMREAQRLAGELQKQNLGIQNGATTPEQWSRSVSAPGTEAFKQDFAKWAILKKNLLVALERTETKLSEQLRSRERGERLNAGRRQAAPDTYREWVDRYYRSLATPRRPSS